MRILPESERPTFSKEAFIGHEWIIPKLKSLLEYMEKPDVNGDSLYWNQVEVLQADMAWRYKRFSHEDFKKIFDELLEEIKSGKYTENNSPMDDEDHAEEEEFEEVTPSTIKNSQESFQLSEKRTIDQFSVGVSFMGDAPQEKWLIKNLIEQGQITGVVAAGGVGKTWIGLDVGLKLASQPSSLYTFSITQQCLTFFITMEDSRDALWRRLEVIDPDKSLRKQAENTFFILTAAEAFDRYFSLLEIEKGGRPKTTENYKWLMTEIMAKRHAYPDLPIVVIFDTYSATHHSDENTALGATQWFKAAALLIKNFNAAVIVMHHIRKIGYHEPLRNPEDFLAAIRGSNAFVNSCRRVIGIWPIKESETKKITTAKTILYNFSNIKDNNFADWSDKDIGIFNRPTMTLMRHEKGYLFFDSEVNEKRKALFVSKNALSEEEESALQEHLLEVIYYFANSGYPLTKSMFDKQEGYANILSGQYLQMPPKTIKSALQFLLDSDKIIAAQIRINNKQCEIYDSPDGDYAGGRSDRRTLAQMPISPFSESTD